MKITIEALSELLIYHDDPPDPAIQLLGRISFEEVKISMWNLLYETNIEVLPLGVTCPTTTRRKPEGNALHSCNLFVHNFNAKKKKKKKKPYEG